MFKKKEVSVFIKDAANPFFTSFLRPKFLTKLLFKEMNTNKDDYISMKEIDDYLQTEFNMTLNDLLDKDVQTVCTMLDKAK